MGREIRCVPKGWEHPKDESGVFIPMFDCTYKEAIDIWKKDGSDPEEKPEAEDGYRPEYQGGTSCFQIYENVTEGTPISPIFETLDELVMWLVNEGYSEHAAKEFAEARWAPSALILDHEFWPDIHSYDAPWPKESEEK